MTDKLQDLKAQLTQLGFIRRPDTEIYSKKSPTGKVCYVDLNLVNGPTMYFEDSSGELIKGSDRLYLIDSNPSFVQLNNLIDKLYKSELQNPPVTVAEYTVLPAIGPVQAINAWKAYQKLCTAILDKSDYQEIQGKRYKKKSAWIKLARVFNLNDSIVDEEWLPLLDGEGFMWKVQVCVTAPNGRSVVGAGICSSRERNFTHLDHDVYATAHTRAKNRAISDIIGAGESSYEEV